jgi:hypothetical protein
MALKLPSPSEIWSHDDQRVRDFGKAFFVVLAAFGAWSAYRALGASPAGTPRLPVIWAAARTWWLAAWAVLTFAAAFPWAMRPVYLLLTVVGMSIGFVLGHAVLALTFFTMFVAIGRMRRASSPVARGFDRQASSYWSAHPKVNSATRYYRQY